MTGCGAQRQRQSFRASPPSAFQRRGRSSPQLQQLLPAGPRVQAGRRAGRQPGGVEGGPGRRGLGGSRGGRWGARGPSEGRPLSLPESPAGPRAPGPSRGGAAGRRGRGSCPPITHSPGQAGMEPAGGGGSVERGFYVLKRQGHAGASRAEPGSGTATVTIPGRSCSCPAGARAPLPGILADNPGLCRVSKRGKRGPGPPTQGPRVP